MPSKPPFLKILAPTGGPIGDPKITLGASRWPSELPRTSFGGDFLRTYFLHENRHPKIAQKVGAFLLSDIAHISGLVASGVHPSPVPYSDFVTTTTHKTLRGPRGGMILMGKDFENPWGKTAPKSGRVKMVSELLDSSIMPGIQGGPLMHIIAAKAVAYKQALEPSFKAYCQQVIDNAKTIANEMKSKGYNLVSDGTDTHLVLIDLSNIRTYLSHLRDKY